MGTLALSSWEFSRATTRACRYMTDVCISNEAVPPVLNKAEVEWISLYVGRKPFQGGDNIQSNFIVDDKVDGRVQNMDDAINEILSELNGLE